MLLYAVNFVLQINEVITRKLSSIEDRGQTVSLPRYHAHHSRWTPALPLVSAAPRRTRRRASAPLTTT